MKKNSLKLKISKINKCFKYIFSINKSLIYIGTDLIN